MDGAERSGAGRGRRWTRVWLGLCGFLRQRGGVLVFAFGRAGFGWPGFGPGFWVVYALIQYTRYIY
jgi:hypothetical protein